MARPPNPEAPRRLLEAARACFAEVGVEAARIQDIAERAGFSKAAFYLYFESKETVFEKLVAEVFKRLDFVADERHCAFQALVEKYGPIRRDDIAGGPEKVFAFWQLDHDYNKRSLQAMWADRDMIACILEQTTGPRRHLVDRFVEFTQKTLLVRLSEAREQGFIRDDIDPDLTAEMLIGIYMQLARRMVRLDAPPDFDAWTRAIDTFVSEGMRNRNLLPPLEPQ